MTIACGVLLNINEIIASTLAAFCMSSFYGVLITLAIVSMVVAFKPTYEELLESQEKKNRQNALQPNFSDDDGSSLREVVVSPGRTSPGSPLYMHGALDPERRSRPEISDRVSAPSSANDSEDNVRADSGGLHDHNSDEEAGQVPQQQVFPRRQDTASSTGTGALQPNLAGKKFGRRVNTK